MNFSHSVIDKPPLSGVFNADGKRKRTRDKKKQSPYRIIFIGTLSFYTGLGFIALFVSYVIGVQVFNSLLMSALSYPLVFALEGARAGMLFFAEVIRRLEDNKWRIFDTPLFLFIRFTLIFIAFFSTFYLVATASFQPNLESTRLKDIALIESDFQKKTEQISLLADNKILQINERMREERKKINEIYILEIRDLHGQLNLETDNVIGGEFEGKRFRSFKNRKDEAEETRMKLTMSLLSQEQREIAAIESRRESDLRKAEELYSSNINRIRSSMYENDPRIFHADIVKFSTTLEELLGTSVPRVWIVLPFAFLVAVALEGVIFFVFTHVARITAPHIAKYVDFQNKVQSTRVAESCIDSLNRSHS